MLNVQNFLRQYSNVDEALEALRQQHEIDYVKNPNDGRTILDYSRFSNRNDNITLECRGLVLDRDDNWKLVARAFPRFFNHVEEGKVKQLDWNNPVECSNKEDGSLAIFYFYQGSWHVNTRASFGNGIINGLIGNQTWRELFYSAFPDIEDYCYDGYTYVFELCSVQNMVVKKYDKPTLFLTGIFDYKGNEVRLDFAGNNFNKVNTFTVTSIDEVIVKLKEKELNDPTFEGYVLKDINKNRMKVKSSSYLILHKSINNGKPSALRLFNSVLDGSAVELVSYFPYLKPLVDEIVSYITDIEFHSKRIYRKCRKLSRREAVSIIGDYEYAFIVLSLLSGLDFYEVITDKIHTLVKRFKEKNKIEDNEE
jgi:hypothetical protein